MTETKLGSAEGRPAPATRRDLKDLGEALDEGDAALIVIGESSIDEQIDKATKRARRVLQRDVDADSAELKREIEDAEKQGAGSPTS